MTIGIDIRCLTEGKITGVEEYAVGFLKKTLENDRENQYVLFINSFKKIETDLKWLEEYPNVEIRKYSYPNKLLNGLIWFFGWPKIDILLGGVNVFFAPNIGFVSVSDKCQMVLTIHDLSFERFPEFFSFKKRVWHFVINSRRLCRRADKILAVSESTKQDLAGLYGIDEKKIEVITPINNLMKYLDFKLSWEDRAKLNNKYKLSKDFILFLGTIEPRKNVVSLIQAFKLLKKGSPQLLDLKLVIAGQSGWSNREVFQVVQNSEYQADIILPGYVDEKDKPALYQMAKIFIYPSFYEGFGFPVAEAMASGTPVITSNCSSFPEVAGDSAILIDPYNPNEIYVALRNLLENKELQNHFRERGKKRAEKIKKKADINVKIV